MLMMHSNLFLESTQTNLQIFGVFMSERERRKALSYFVKHSTNYSISYLSQLLCCADMMMGIISLNGF